MGTSLKQLNKLTEVIANTADFDAIKPYDVTEATTNPVLIYKAATLPKYAYILQKGVEYGVKTGETSEETIDNSMNMINVLFGVEILKVVRNRVQIQLDPRFAFSVDGNIVRALKIIRLFSEKGIDKNKVVIKIPSTWEGIQAARILENTHKINCNMTTMFSLIQAAACVDAGISYIAPFVTSVNQWYHERNKASERQEGVETLKSIQSYVWKFGIETKVMAANFSHAEEVSAIAGCDVCTIQPELLEDFSKNKYTVTNNMERNLQIDKIVLNEHNFKWLMNEDEMVTELLSKTLRNFGDHYVKLENIVKNLIDSNNKST